MNTTDQKTEKAEIADILRTDVDATPRQEFVLSTGRRLRVERKNGRVFRVGIQRETVSNPDKGTRPAPKSS